MREQNTASNTNGAAIKRVSKIEKYKEYLKVGEVWLPRIRPLKEGETAPKRLPRPVRIVKVDDETEIATVVCLDDNDQPMPGYRPHGVAYKTLAYGSVPRSAPPEFVMQPSFAPSWWAKMAENPAPETRAFLDAWLEQKGRIDALEKRVKKLEEACHEVRAAIPGVQTSLRGIGQ